MRVRSGMLLDRSRWSRRMISLLWLGVVVLFPARAHAQDPQLYAMGTDPNATYHVNDIDHVDMSDYRVQWHIPLLVDHSQRGKLNFTYSLSFSSSAWVGSCDDESRTYCNWEPALPANVVAPQGVTFGTDGVLSYGTECSYDGSSCDDEAIESDNSVHHLGVTYLGSAYQNEESIDGSGIRLNYNYDPYSITLINKDGVLFLPTSSNAILDPNGNVITFQVSGQTTTMTDTLGRSWTTTTGTTNTDNCPVSASNATLWDTPGPNGTTREFKFCYSGVAFNTSLPQLNIQPSGSTAQYRNTGTFLTGVVLPDLSTWQFDYDAYGDLAYVHLPTGGTISYTWTLDCTAWNFCYRSIATRTDGTSSNPWSYGADSSGNKVTDPMGNDTVYVVGFGGPGAIINSIISYSGSDSGSPIQTLPKTYQSILDPYSADVHGGNPTYISLPLSTATVWPNGQTKNDQLTYDPGFSYTDYNPTPWCGTTGICDSVYGLVISEAHSDYGTNSPIFTTNTNYKALSVVQYLWANLLNLPSSQTVTDANSNLCAETDYDYDASSYIDHYSGALQNHPGAPTAGIFGDLTSVTRKLFNNPCTSPNPAWTPSTTYNHVYDTGMLHTSTDPRNNPAKALDYSSAYYGAYPTQVCTYGLCTNYTYDFETGLMATMTDPNSQQTTYSWDCMLRPTEVVHPDMGQETLTYLYGGSSGCGSGNAFTGFTYSQKITSSLNYVKTSLTDGLGRVYETQLTSDPLGTDYTDTSYDGDGRIGSVSNPCRSTPATNCGDVSYSYDGLNRVTLVTNQDGTTVSTAYSVSTAHAGDCTNVTDEANRARTSCVDGAGRTTGVWEDPTGLNYETDYTYNANGDLTAVNQGGSRSRSFAYNSLSWLLTATNPESGTISYGYDANGNVTSRTGPKQNQTGASTVTTTYSIDSANRITGKSYDDGFTPSVTLYYDQTSQWGSTILNSIGRLTAAQTPNVASELFSYDPMGRPMWQFQQTPLDYAGYFFEIMYSYNLAGGITEHDDGLGDVFYQSFDGAGRVTQVGSNLSDSNHPNPLATTDSSNGYWPAGQIRQMLLGNGLTETTAYNNRLQPCHINVNSSGTAYSLCTDSVPNNSIQDFGYGYNAGVSDNGNVAYWSGTGAQSFARNYAYDNVNRLLNYSASSDDPTGCTGLSWNDDQWGNRTDQTVTGGSCPTFHALMDGNNNNRFCGSGCSQYYQYDAAGNMTYDGSHHYYYDAENRLIQVDGTFDGTLSSCSAAGACYLYDYAGHRVQRIVGGGTPANYLYDLDGHVNSEIDLANGSFDNSNHKLGWWASYIYLNGSLLAEYNAGTTYFAHKDHLGSTRLLTDMNGCVAENLDYFPYGELYPYTSSCPAPDRTLNFTGKERDSESGLDNFGARYDSSRYGRFMTPDWASVPTPVPYADMSDPQSLNLYAYVRNNPLSKPDIDGHQTVCDSDTYSNDKDGNLVVHAGACHDVPDPQPGQSQPILQQMASRLSNALSRTGAADRPPDS